jgi:probable F420-dependent oxidoreductase
LGIDALLSGDHVVLPLQDRHEYPHSVDGSFGISAADPQAHLNDSMAVLAFMAAATKRLQVGTSVWVLPYRHPVLTAKAWATLDVLSGGRAICGVGLGWVSKAFEVLGVPYTERGAVADEYLEAMRVLWTAHEPRFHGTYCAFDDIGFYPKPVQDPLPVWVGGHTDAAICRAARFGDCWHLSRKSPEFAASRIPFLHECVRAAGRDPEQVKVSIKRRLHFTDLGLEYRRAAASTAEDMVGSTAEVIADVRSWIKLGITQVTYDFVTPDIDEQMAVMSRFAEHVLPAVRS